VAEAPTPAEQPVEVMDTKDRPITTLTVRQDRALETFGGSKQYPLATLGDAEFADLLARMGLHYDRMKEVQRSLMKPGVHYGIPGKKPEEVKAAIAGDGTKVGLFKAGMEVLLKMHRYVADVKQTTHYGDPENVGSPAIRVDSICYIHADSLEGPTIAVGVGSANSWETKYRYRRLERTCPACHKPALIYQKEAKGGEFRGKPAFWCAPFKEGCGGNFAGDDKEITEQEVGRTANGEAYDLENTLVKMSAKRAKVDGTITATGSSDLFTQDLEDLSPAARARVSAEIDAGAKETTDAMYGAEDPDAWRAAPTVAATQPARAAASPEGAREAKPATEKQRGALSALLATKLGARTEDEQTDALQERVGVGWGELTAAQASEQITALNKLPDAGQGSAATAAAAPSRAAALTQKPTAIRTGGEPDHGHQAGDPAPKGPLADTGANRDYLAKRIREMALEVETAFTGRRVIVVEDGIAYIAGGNEMALLKLKQPTPLDQFDVPSLEILGRYLKSELNRKGVAA